MTVTANAYAPPAPKYASCVSRYGIGKQLGMMGSGGAFSNNVAWPAANRAILIPFTTDTDATVTAFTWYNGSAVSGNVDAGIYNTAGTLMCQAGSTAQSGTSATQTKTLGTPYDLVAGEYYLALCLDNATGRLQYAATATEYTLRSAGMCQAVASVALPASVTLAALTSNVLPFIVVTFA